LGEDGILSHYKDIKMMIIDAHPRFLSSTYEPLLFLLLFGSYIL